MRRVPRLVSSFHRRMSDSDRPSDDNKGNAQLPRGSPAITSLDMFAVSASLEGLDSGRHWTTSSAVQHCPPKPRVHKARILQRDGSGTGRDDTGEREGLGRPMSALF
jgi:hypothetical protein